jgi:hypothetical protein
VIGMAKLGVMNHSYDSQCMNEIDWDHVLQCTVSCC